jgi:hypothetical protein
VAQQQQHSAASYRTVVRVSFAIMLGSKKRKKKKNKQLPRASKKCGGMHAEWKGWRHTAWLELPVLGRVSIVESKTKTPPWIPRPRLEL